MVSFIIINKPTNLPCKNGQERQEYMKKCMLSLMVGAAVVLSGTTRVFAYSANGAMLSAQTRDSTPVALLVTLLAVSACGLIVLFLLRTKRGDQE